MARLKDLYSALRGLEKALSSETWSLVSGGVGILSDIASSWALGAIETALNVWLQMRVQIRWPVSPQRQTCYGNPSCASKGYAVDLNSGRCTEKLPAGYGVAWWDRIGGAIGVTEKVFRRTCSGGGLHHGEWLGNEGYCYNNYQPRQSRRLAFRKFCNNWRRAFTCHQPCGRLGSGWKRQDPLYCIRDCPR